MFTVCSSVWIKTRTIRQLCSPSRTSKALSSLSRKALRTTVPEELFSILLGEKSHVTLKARLRDGGCCGGAWRRGKSHRVPGREVRNSSQCCSMLQSSGPCRTRPLWFIARPTPANLVEFIKPWESVSLRQGDVYKLCCVLSGVPPVATLDPGLVCLLGVLPFPLA